MRNFKPGDRVQLRKGSPVMIVQCYAKEFNVWLGWHESNLIVVCTWLDEKGRHKKKFHQKDLIKQFSSSNAVHSNQLVNQKRV